MKEYQYDAVVVGSGPGGSMAAKNIAERGYSVLIVEKRSEIGVHVRCGEGLARGLLEDTGIKPDSRWIDLEVDGARIFAPDERYHVDVDHRMAGAETGYVIDRGRFDKYLATSAIKAGSDLWLKSPAIAIEYEGGIISGSPVFGFENRDPGKKKPVAVIVRKCGEIVKIKTNLIIGADGVEAHVARWANIDVRLEPKDIITGIEYRMVNIDIDPKWVDFYIGYKIAPGGYIWCFPKSDEEANIGIGLQLSSIESKGKLKEYLDKWIEMHDWARGGKPVHIITGAVPVSHPPDCVINTGVMLVGDAARVSDALTGGGIAHAIITGREAGIVASEAIEAGDVSTDILQRYEERWRDILENKLWRNWLAKEKFTQLSDETLNKIISLLMDVDLKEMTTYNLIKAVAEKYPEVAKDLEEIL